MCGIVGIYATDNVVKDIYQGLLAIQHRGQDSAGIVTYDGRFHTKKGNGLVRDIFTAENFRRLKGNIGIGHTRYPTVGGGSGEDAQPFLVNSPFGIIMAHNGNVINYAELKETIFNKYHRLLNSDNDVEAILNIFAQELAEQKAKKLKPQHIFKAVEGVFSQVKGGYSVVAYIAEQGLVAFRDPFGIKPLVYGRQDNGGLPSYAIASESVCLDIMNFSHIKNVEAGQVVFIDQNRKIHTRKLTRCAHTPCLFEWVYFARPDSFIDNVNVYDCRVHLGRFLADEIKKHKLDIDVVVPVPDSARDAAIEIARALDLKYREALVKNRYIGRTFIMPADQTRRSSVRQKLNPIVSELKGKNVLLVDDSIVRGHTSRAIVEMVRECGAKKVYFGAYSPPLRFPCVYGIDMQTKTEFVARNANLDQIAKKIGVDKVIYQNLELLKKAVNLGNDKLTNFCAACFDGIYPTGDVTSEILKDIEKKRKTDKENQLELNF
ncbi:MAG: amidophosphoribosyltransferase [Candidatus Aminicenantes bacterium]|nr:MAG: amidophosphoribosyltransferase [Candidatus Aminicenantes bacterium]